jgi:predicted  nucleic acid-binding Zn-ribbon protein
MGGASLDSTKILAEKLSLSRELATLRPELEHLRAQAASQQKAVAEKLALQRQLNALEVELEMAKNLTKKNTTAPVTQTVHHEAQAEIVRLRKDVAKEKKQRDATESMARREVQEWEARSSALEDKLDNMRSKLRSLQEQLKATQAELSKTKEVSKDAVAAQSKTQRGLKRKADVVETDIMLGTPGQGPARGKRARGKRNGLENVGLGEKSMFSITPYLNKTADVESVLQQPEQAADRKADPVNHGTTIGKEPSIPEGMSSPLVNATPSRPVQNAKTATTKSKSALSLPLSKTQTLAPIDEEAGSDTNNPAVTSTNVVREDTVGAAATSADPTGPKKKKRKLLGSNKTIFDEDEAEQIKRPVKTALNPLANKKFLGKKSGAQLNGLGCAGLTFSPLKRDRRGGVQASFLA